MRDFGTAPATGGWSGVLAMVHEARVVAAAGAARTEGVDMVAPTLRQIGIQVFDRIELVVEVAVDQGAARPRCSLFSYRGRNRHDRRPPFYLHLIELLCVRVPNLVRERIGQ